MNLKKNHQVFADLMSFPKMKKKKKKEEFPRSFEFQVAQSVTEVFRRRFF